MVDNRSEPNICGPNMHVLARAHAEAIFVLQNVMSNPIPIVKALMPFALVVLGVLAFLWIFTNIVTEIRTPSLKVSTTASECNQAGTPFDLLTL